MAGLTYDGIPSTRTDSSTFSGTTVLASVVSGVNFRIGSIVDASGRLQSNNNGATFGARIEAGSAIASNVSVGVTFNTAFTAIPRVVIGVATSGTNADGSYIGSTTTAGFIFSGPSGLVHNFIAVGV